MQTIRQARKELAQSLSGIGLDGQEAARQAEMIIEYATGLPPVEQIVKADKLLGEEELARLETVLAQRQARMPLQYCLGYAWFMGMKLSVRPGVLIPRHDTECLVAVACELLAGNPAARIVDVGTGSGAIAIALLRHLPEATVHAIDINLQAVELCRENALALNVWSRLTLVNSDWISAMPAHCDAIISNPPYIPRCEYDSLPSEISQYEPESALFGSDADGLGFYRQIASLGQEYLKESGFIAVEVGDGQAHCVLRIFQDAGWSQVSIHNDIHGLARVVSAAPRISAFSNP